MTGQKAWDYHFAADLLCEASTDLLREVLQRPTENGHDASDIIRLSVSLRIIADELTETGNFMQSTPQDQLDLLKNLHKAATLIWGAWEEGEEGEEGASEWSGGPIDRPRPGVEIDPEIPF